MNKFKALLLLILAIISSIPLSSFTFSIKKNDIKFIFPKVVNNTYFFGSSFAIEKIRNETRWTISSPKINLDASSGILFWKSSENIFKTSNATECSEQSIRDLPLINPNIQKLDGNRTLVCSTNRIYKCGAQRFLPGFCYKKAIGQDNWVPMKSLSGCKPAFLDLMFTIDGSGSLSKYDFIKIKSWIKKVASDVFNEITNLQIGLIQFSTEPKIDIPFESYNPGQFNRNVDQIDQLDGTTDTAKAISKAIEELKKSALFKNATSVIVLLTDGRANYAHGIVCKLKSKCGQKDSFDKANKAGIDIFAVGVGKYISKKDLQIFANGEDSNKKVYTAEDFDVLQSIITRLKFEIIEVTLDGTK